MTAYLQSDLTKLWASHQFQGDVEAQWSDYGYIKRDGTGEMFVRLGNIYDVVRPTGKLTTFLLRRYGGCDWERAEDFPLPEKIVR